MASRVPVIFARNMIALGLRKYSQHPDMRASSAKWILMHAARLARPFLGDAEVRALVEQALREQPMSVVEVVD